MHLATYGSHCSVGMTKSVQYRFSWEFYWSFLFSPTDALYLLLSAKFITCSERISTGGRLRQPLGLSSRRGSQNEGVRYAKRKMKGHQSHCIKGGGISGGVKLRSAPSLSLPSTQRISAACFSPHEYMYRRRFIMGPAETPLPTLNSVIIRGLASVARV